MKPRYNDNNCFSNILSSALRRLVVILAFFAVSCPAVRAQLYDFDVPTVEASIKDHKRIQSILIGRNAVEAFCTSELNTFGNNTIVNYEKACKSLDEFNHLFDVLDAITHGAHCVITVVDVAKEASNLTSDYYGLLEYYTSKMLLKGNIMPEDTIIVTNIKDMIGKLGSEATQLKLSLDMMAGYASGMMQCNTAEMIDIILDIETSLRELVDIVRKSYNRTYQYVLLRISGFHKKGVPYARRNISEIANGCLATWVQGAKDVIQTTANK